MKYVHRFGTGSYSAFRVTSADFTGEAFSAPPFEGEVSEDAWLQAALQEGTVALMPNRGTTHAVWHVTTVGAEVILASPGDYIVKPDNDDNLYVCHGPLWEMLTEPVVKDEFSLDDKIKEILKAAAEEMRYGHEIDWSAFMAKLNRDVEALVPVTRGIGNFYRESISDDAPTLDQIQNNDVAESYPAGKVAAPKNLKEAMGLDTDEEVRAQLSMEVVDKARQLILRTASEEVVDWKALSLQLEYASQMLKDERPADFDNIVIAVNHMIKTTPGEATLAEVCDYFQGEIVQKRLNDWCDRVHLAMVQLNPTKLADWRGFLNEADEIIGDNEPERLPLAWFKTYGIVGVMAKAVNFMQPGSDEFEGLQSAKAIAQTMVNMAEMKKGK